MRSAIQLRTIAVVISFSVQAAAFCASEFDSEMEKALAPVKAFVAETVSAAERKKIILQTVINGSLRDAEVLGADKLNLKLKLGNDEVEQPWEKVSSRNIYALARECVQDDLKRAIQLSEYAKAAGLREKAEDAIALAKKISRMPRDPKVVPNEQLIALKDVAQNAANPQNTSVEGAAADPIVVPAKIAFRPSSKGLLTPVAEVAAAIDNVIEIDLAEMGMKPEPVCDDFTFLRRASLDLTGMIPSPEEIITFHRDTSPQKREKKIEELMARPEYIDHWTSFLSMMLVGRQTPTMQTQFQRTLTTWLREQIVKNVGYDKIVAEMIGARSEAPPANYLAYHLSGDTAPNTADHISRTFLGTRIGCAQCHDHPFDKWTQKDFWGMAGFLSYTAGQYNGLLDDDERLTGPKYDPPDPSFAGPPRPLEGTDSILWRTPADQRKADQEKRNREASMRMQNVMMYNMQPAKQNDMAYGFRYRTYLANWITDPANDRFDNAIINRMWKSLFGYGMVEPVDDIRPKNPATHPEALEILAHDFKTSGRDLRRMISVIANTRAYQRASTGKAIKAERQNLVRYAGRAEIRPMTPEMLFVAVLKATGGDDKARKALKAIHSGTNRSQNQFYERRNDSNSDVDEFYELLQRFFAKSNPTGAESNLQFEGSFTQALMMMHSGFMQRAIRDAVTFHSRKGMGDPVYLFAVALGRPPTKEESAACAKCKDGLQEIMWVLMNSAEFVTIR
jgi:hypothetical protein